VVQLCREMLTLEGQIRIKSDDLFAGARKKIGTVYRTADDAVSAIIHHIRKTVIEKFYHRGKDLHMWSMPAEAVAFLEAEAVNVVGPSCASLAPFLKGSFAAFPKHSLQSGDEIPRMLLTTIDGEFVELHDVLDKAKYTVVLAGSMT